MKRSLTVIVILLSTFLITACSIVDVSPPTDTAAQATTQATEPAPQPQALATVKLNIPAIAPWVVTSKPGAAARSSAGKAYLGASKVVLELYHCSYYYGWSFVTLLDSFEITQTISTEKLAPQPTTLHVTLPTGTDFGFKVYIYNSNVGTDHVAYGESDVIAITVGGENTFSVICAPASVESLPADEETPTEWTLAQYGEKWFRFDPVTLTPIIKCTTTAGDADIYIFGTDNRIAASSALGGTSIDAVEVTPGSWLVGVWAFAASTFTIECNESSAGATVIVE
jgi:hypothetical protein